MAKEKGQGPKFVAFFGPVLKAVMDLGGSARPSEVCDRVATDLKISAAEQDEPMASGTSRLKNQIHWARFYLSKAGYIDSSKATRGLWTLTDKGRAAVPMGLDQANRVFKETHSAFPRPVKGNGDDGVTPDPEPELRYREEVLSIIRSLPASGFERLCQRVLREAGFEQVTVTGRSGDGGIDGIGMLQVNSLVSFKVLFQCKRYREVGVVNVSQVRDFRGAMAGRADKGIMITTASFTSDAEKEAIRDGVPPLELINGERLVDLLEKFQIGLKPVQTYEVDEAFFGEFK